MHEWIDDTLEAVARADLGKPSDDDDLDDAQDYGFYHNYRVAMYTWLFHKSHGTLPEAGGLLDQDWELVFDDWGTVNQRYNRIITRLRADDDGEGGNLDDFIGDDAPGVRDLF